jgi:hypothetical protein
VTDERLGFLQSQAAVDWDAAEWTRELVVSSMPAGDSGHVNLYFHGWLWPRGLFDPDSEEATAFPLIGLMEPWGSLGYCVPGSLGPLRDDSLLPAGGGLRACDQHVHDGVCLGADMAHVNVSPGGNPGGGTVVAVDVRAPWTPRFRVSTLVVLPRPEDVAAAGAAVAAKGDLSGDTQEWVACVAAAVPALQAVPEWAALL